MVADDRLRSNYETQEREGRTWPRHKQPSLAEIAEDLLSFTPCAVAAHWTREILNTKKEETFEDSQKFP